MKVLFFTLLFVAGAFARSAVQQQEVKAEGPACPIEDPLQRDGPLPLNVSVNPILELAEGCEVTNLIAVGLSSLHYNVEIFPLLLTASFEVTIAATHGNGTFIITTGYLDARPFEHGTIPSGNLTGSGVGKVDATDVKLRGTASLFINIIGNKVGISILSLNEVHFASLSVDFGPTLLIGGSPVDWAALSANIKQNFDSEFAAKKGEITERIREAANGIVGKYTLAELIDLIGGGDGGEDPEC